MILRLAFSVLAVSGGAQEDAAAEKLFRQLTDDQLEVREKATRQLIDEYERYRDAVERRWTRSAELPVEERSRLEDVRRKGPPVAERRALERRLGEEFLSRNRERVRDLFEEDEARFAQAVDDLYRKNSDRSDDFAKVECFLFALRRASAKGWKRGLETADMFLVQQYRTALRERITESVRPLIRGENVEGAWRAVRLLGRAGPGARPEIEMLIEDPRPDVARVAFTVLGEMLTSKDIPYIARFLKDPDPWRRDGAIRVLVRLRAEEQADAIAELLDDRMYFVRRAAMDALGRLKAHRHAARLVSWLVEDPGTGRQDSGWAFGALKELRSEAAEDETVKLTRNPDPKARALAVALLGHWNSSRHSVSVMPLLGDPDEKVRSAAVEALAAMDSKLDIEEIAGRLEDCSPEVRARAAVALGKLGARHKADRILKALAEKKLEPEDAAEALILMKSEAHGPKAAEILLGLARELYPPGKRLIGCGLAFQRHDRLDRTLRTAVDQKYDSCLEPLAKEAAGLAPEARGPIYRALESSGCAARVIAAGPGASTPEGRHAAMKALATAPDGAALSSAMDLIRAAKDEEMFHLESYALPFKAVPRDVVRYLEDADAKVRGLAGRLLCEARDARFVPAAVKLLKDPDRGVRGMMIQYLRHVPTREHHAALAEALRDPDPWVRCIASGVVSELDLREHAAEVAALLGEAPGKDFDPRAYGIEALVKLEARSEAKGILLLVGDPVVGPRAIRAIGELRAEEGTETLSKLARDGSGLSRQEAVRALAVMGKKDTLPGLGELLRDEEAGLRAAAAFSAGALRERTLEEALAARLKDPAAPVQAEAARALGLLGASARSKAIEELVGSKEWVVWNAALEALVRLEARDQAVAIARRMEDAGEPFKAHAILRALIRLDAKAHMDALVSASSWASTVYYELNVARSPQLYEAIGKTRLTEYSLLGSPSHEGLAAALERAHGVKLRFSPAVPEAVRQRNPHLQGLWKDTHRWLEVFAIPRECAPIFDAGSGEIRLVPVEEAKRFWWEWASGNQ